MATRSRRRPRRDEEDVYEEEEKPRRSRRRSREDDEYEDDYEDEEEPEEPPRRRRRSRDDDEEEEPRRRRRRREEPEDDFEDEEEEEEERPRRSRGGKSSDKPKAAKPDIRDGWGGAQQTYDESSSYAQAFKLENETKVICFLEARPYAGYSRHWIERTITDDSGKRKKTKRPYTCLASVGMGECPVCDAGDKAQAVSSFNVAEINDDGTPFHKSWDVGVKLFNILKAYNNDRKVGPLDKPELYFLVSRSGSGGSTNYQINPVQGDDGLERADTLAPYPEDLEALMDKCYTKDILDITSRKEMREIAAELADYDDDYDD